ncbi:PHD finger protein 3 isoform X2 [Pogoniulus pusillus]|uniref:PHD finger protein 3 isoform X2 n=3 Tax=Pogoniulus pusillus TaxID=488313 RepID=UPI0030B95383
MEEEGVKESGGDTIADDELVLPNRPLRSRAEEAAAVTSPRKSPRLMAQEAVRSLRQSTLAKRSKLTPPVSIKKASAKGGAAARAGQKAERSPVKDTEAAAAPRTEQAREVRRSTRRSGQVEGTEAAVAAAQGDSPCPTAPKGGSESLEQAEAEETSQELTCADVAEASPPPEGAKEILKAAAGAGHAEAVCSGPADTEVTAVQNAARGVSEPMGSELSAEEETDSRPEGLQKTPEEHEQSGAAGEAEDASAGVDPSDVSEPLPDLPSPAGAGTNCSLGSHSRGAPSENALSEQDGGAEPAGETSATATEELLGSTEPGQKALTGAELPSAGAGSSSVESTAAERPSPGVQQQVSPQAAECEGAERQPEASSRCERNVRPRLSKPAAQTKPPPPAAVRQKLGTTQAKPARSRTRAGLAGSGLHSPPSAGLKRSADEQEGAQSNPVKVRKKESDPGFKAKGCVPGLKKQSSAVLKKTARTQAPWQAQKSSVQRASERSPTHQGSSRDPHHALHLPSPAQKQAQPQRHQLPTVLRANSCAKEEAETKDSPVLEQPREEDREKSRCRRAEKSLQPRQRRSSRSLSLEEPPLFIPDNIASVRREGAEQPCADSRHAWVPSRHCGFCRKPHGNRFMVGCGRCDDWFHGDCVGLSLAQAQRLGEEDKEYVCVRCCAEEDGRMESSGPAEAPGRAELQREEKGPDGDRAAAKQTPPGADRSRQADDAGKHKVKIFRRESGDGKSLAEPRDMDAKKGQQLPVRKGPQSAAGLRRSPEDKQEKLSREALSVPERSSKPGVHEKPELKKKKSERSSVAAAHPQAVPASKPSADQIRQSVKQSLKEILMKRLSDSSLKIPEERAAKVATRIERELFSFFRDTDSKYKNKYRSLMFNLKDPKNNILFKKVLKGEVTPEHLIRMSPEELASKELAAWRQRENRHTIEMIEKEQREVERRPITKITHKGEIEIESEAPMKEQEEAMDVQEPSLKLLEKAEEADRDREVPESASPDTTSQHKNHLFDLNCKICIGRMAPPSDALSSRKVKVSVGVARKPSDNEAESIADALSSTSSILAAELLEDDKQDPAKSSLPPLPKSETPGTVECESLFLARLNFIWKGFINMPSVAKFVIKAYPVSGSFEYLTEDLPDSIQVGGRISPQTVWEYVEKIKASGTKEICVVRFTPVTEEDQISYALLFAYFSSRKRYGVAANNMKQVKDLYLIPLGSSDKVPHHLVPFDGPGIEVHRPNLLLGLIIRQKMKRQIPAVATAAGGFVDEPAESSLGTLPPEKKSKPSKPEVSQHELALEEEEENDFFNSFTAVLHKQRNKPQQASAEDAAAVTEPLVDSTKHEPPKPLRFLPGVLVGWENQPSALELANKPLPVDDILQSLLGTTGQVFEPSKAAASSSEDIPLLNEQAASQEEDMDLEGTPEDTEAKAALDDPPEPSSAAVDAAAGVASGSSRSAGSLVGLSLKGKPPDVSTEAFLTTLSAQNKETEEGKENDPKRQLPDKDSAAQEARRTTPSSLSSSSSSSAGKKPNENNLAAGSSEGATATTSKSPPFINLKRDPRQAAGRSQQAAESKEGEASRGEERQGTSGAEPAEADCKQPSAEAGLNPYQGDAQSSEAQQGAAAAKAESATADAKQPSEDALLQGVEAAAAFRRGSAAAAAHFEAENPSRSDFLSQVPSPVPGSSFPPVRAPQQNFQHPKCSPAGFQFQAPAPPSFPPQSSPMFAFPPHLPPPLLPPPAFGFPQGPMVPWPPVAHLPGQPPHFTGPLPPGLPPVAHKQPRFLGADNFFLSKDSRRPERRHSDPWGRQEQPQHPERGFSRGKGEQHRQRFYSESQQQKKERHEKEWSWEQESERNRRRDRNQEKERERERKGREEGQRDKERARSPHAAEGKSPRETKNPEKKGEKPKPEEDKERSKEKHREREGEKSRDRHRDHSDRSKSKR